MSDWLPADTMSSIGDPVCVVDGASAGLGVSQTAGALQGDLEGQAVGGENSSADDSLAVDQLHSTPHQNAQRQTGQDHLTCFPQPFTLACYI